ncbi:regulatory protein ral2 [Zopfia rhizophila CBS 207.26]|uniref:Regulatory protein ral2 n=1 Tax=Zopfia rhizophila CBS 207.26 TaxID=1314779 RepID=A0A6A6DGD7_9PEZI|nr:regulatory protein ral2 [Zopfia rhizophila CBS 207.26]
MARQTPNTSRTNTIDSQTSAPSPSQLYPDQFRGGTGAYVSNLNGSQTSLNRQDGQDAAADRAPTSASARTPGSGVAPSPAMLQTAGLSTPSSSTSGLSGLVCNVHRTTGREPHPLVGATTTILGDKLFVFGGRKLSRTRPQLTSDLYELDLVRRHWTKVEAKGDIPPPRYFHSVCALGDTKLVCYGGMSPATLQPGQPAPPQQSGADAQPEVVVMSDVHIYDVPTRAWMHVATADSPQGRYAHCATILPSSAIFTSSNAPLSAIRHNPSSSNPNQGSIGVQLDGEGGAEMVVVGGQDSANHYIEQISVFNLRSLKWTATNTLGRSCGAYRSVVAPLTSIDPNKIGAGIRRGSDVKTPEEQNSPARDGGASMLIYSNYNFLDVKLELQVRHPDGALSEKPMHGSFSPPGLRFPNGGVINNHFVVSGTFLTSSKQEYALWALDLRTLSWGRIDVGGSIFSQGSWNRGVLWNRRNCFVILGNRKRSLVEDYNHRRINFSNICVVELEAFGLYDNPRKGAPNSAYTSVSAPRQTERLDFKAGGRMLSPAAIDLGQLALGMRELADMDFLAIGGERIPVNSHLIARRWGPYFNQLLRESTTTLENADTATLRPTTTTHPSRNSSITITPSIKTNYSAATTLTNNTVTTDSTSSSAATSNSALNPPDPSSQPPSLRPRALYLPHTHLTIQALVHFLYTASLPPQNSPLCSPQILCSLLQLARPYHIDGLLEAIIERLHVLLDNRNTAAIFNAAAMAAGGGSGIAFLCVNGVALNSTSDGLLNPSAAASNPSMRSLDPALRALRINTDVNAGGSNPSGRDDEVSSATSTSTSASASDSGLGDGSAIGNEREVWTGEVSAVVGLQKRGLRGLMEGRRIREMGRGSSRTREDSAAGSGGDGVGLGLLGSGS